VQLTGFIKVGERLAADNKRGLPW